MYIDCILIILYIDINIVYWSCILQTCWIHLLVLTVFSMVSLGFSAYNIVSSANRDSFISCFSIWIPFIPVSCLISLARISSTMLNRNGYSRPSCLVLDLSCCLKSLMKFQFSVLSGDSTAISWNAHLNQMQQYSRSFPV